MFGRNRLHTTNRSSCAGAVLFDIGGGSSELVRLERSQRKPLRPAVAANPRLDFQYRTAW